MSSDLDLFQSGRAGSIISVEHKRGSDCSLTDGASSRVLTLANTATSASEIVSLNGQVLTLTTDYTVSHLGSSSTITFVNAIFNSDFISVRYFT